MEPLLTIAVPSYNMQEHLPKNLPTYVDSVFEGRLEVIILDNASEDRTTEIAEEFVQRYPSIFRLLRRDSRGYGSSINAALAEAKGVFFRIVDADDWVDTGALKDLLGKLEHCPADVIQTNYRRVVMGTGEELPARAVGVEYGRLYTDFAVCQKNVPCIHSTAYRTNLLREHGITLQDGIFFVDEEFVILPFLYATNVVFYDVDLYRYLVGNPTQSTSPQNRAKYAPHREQVVRRLIDVYKTAQMNPNAQSYCFFRISQAAGDHLTTLYMVLPNRAEGRRKGLQWEQYVCQKDAGLYQAIRIKGAILRLLNRLHVGLPMYGQLKRLLLRRG